MFEKISEISTTFRAQSGSDSARHRAPLPAQEPEEYQKLPFRIPALRQKLKIGQTVSIDYHKAYGMGLDPKLTAREPILNKKVKKYIPRTAKEGSGVGVGMMGARSLGG